MIKDGITSAPTYLESFRRFHHNSNNSIKFNSIRVYLRANLTAQRPITKLARVHRNTQK
jgi:hypothetical protein